MCFSSQLRWSTLVGKLRWQGWKWLFTLSPKSDGRADCMLAHSSVSHVIESSLPVRNRLWCFQYGVHLELVQGTGHAGTLSFLAGSWCSIVL